MLPVTVKTAFLNNMFSAMENHVSLVLIIYIFFVLKTYFKDIQSGFLLPRHYCIIKKVKKKRKRSQKGRHNEIIFYCRVDTLVCSCQFSLVTIWDFVKHKYIKQVSLQHGGMWKLSNLTNVLEQGQRLNHANKKELFLPKTT